MHLAANNRIQSPRASGNNDVWFYHLKSSLEKAGSVMQWCHSEPRFCLSFLSAIFYCSFKYYILTGLHSKMEETGIEKNFLLVKFYVSFPGRTISGCLPEASPFVSLARYGPGPLFDQFQAKENWINPIPNPSILAWVGAYLSWPQGLSTHHPNRMGLLLARKMDVDCSWAKCEQWLPCFWRK